jgi:tetratricopeptide (TPR) repeat protein
MDQIRYYLITLLFVLFLFGCNESPKKAVSVRPQSKEAILPDSLQKLDSLVLRCIAKNTDESLNYARQAGKLAHSLKTPAAWAKAYNILGNAYAVISIDSGFYFYHKALTVADSFNLADQKGKLLYSLGMLNSKAGNYRNCILLIDSAYRFSISVNDFTTISNSLNSIGGFYYDIGEKVIARKLFDSAFAVAKRKLLYLQMGSALGNLSRFETDPQKSIPLQRRAISYLERANGSDVPVAFCLINIGYRTSDPDSAIFYYNKAVKMIVTECAPEVIIGAYNNMAYCYLEKGDRENAEKCIVEYALPVAVKTNNIDWQSTVYDTYADVIQQRGNSTDAMAYRKKAIEAKKAYIASVSASLNAAKIK